MSRLDFIGIPSRDAERSRSFYVDTLGMRPDAHAPFEAWVSETCFAIWEPERLGLTCRRARRVLLQDHREDVPGRQPRSQRSPWTGWKHAHGEPLVRPARTRSPHSRRPHGENLDGPRPGAARSSQSASRTQGRRRVWDAPTGRRAGADGRGFTRGSRGALGRSSRAGLRGRSVRRSAPGRGRRWVTGPGFVR